MSVNFHITIMFVTTNLVAAGYLTTSAKYAIISEPFHLFCYTSIYSDPEIYRNNIRISECNRNTNEQYFVECSYLGGGTYNLTLTIPKENMTDDENQSVWSCKDDPSSHSLNNFTLKVTVPIESVTISPKAAISQQPSIVHGLNTTVQCQVVDARPPAKFQWFIDSERVYDPSLFTVSVTGSETTRYNVTSTLSLRFDKYKNLRTVKCSANNIEDETAIQSSSTNIEFMFSPREPPTIEGYSTGQRLFIKDPSLLLVCKVATSWPKPTLDFVCMGQKQISEDTKDYVVRKITLVVSEELNGQSCACIATHPVGDYRKKAQIIFTVIDPTELSRSNSEVDLIKSGIVMITLGATFFVLSATLMIIWKRSFCRRKCAGLHTKDITNTIEDRQMDYIAENYEVLQRPQLTTGSTATSNEEKPATLTDSSEVYSNTTFT